MANVPRPATSAATVLEHVRPDRRRAAPRLPMKLGGAPRTPQAPLFGARSSGCSIVSADDRAGLQWADRSREETMTTKPAQAQTPRGINHLVLNVRNMEVSHKFWTEILGFKCV